MVQLPIMSVLPTIKELLRAHRNLVLTAPPGAGKTTVVPLALLAEPWLQGRRILMLQPRRLAARVVTRYMAASLGEPVGATVGYRVRMDSKVGPQTRLEVLTEGILVRMLQSDPALADVGAVIFDEFHERNLFADLGLALALQAQAILREDLRIVVMSATLDAGPVATLLGGAPVVAAEGRAFPVATHYRQKRIEGLLEPAVVDTIKQAIRTESGDVLVFLPGAGEIRRVKSRLESGGGLPGTRVAPLYGNLPQTEQDLAILPSKPGERKIVLATSLAETSLTVEGVKVVVDSGLMRVPRFSPRSGMTRLETVQVSRASADQRRGRAGRLGPGVCYRLWTEQDEPYFQPNNKPEILEADLATLALELAVWGVRAPADLLWLDHPPAAALRQATDLLIQLGAITYDGIATPHGRAIAAAGVHPRLAHMIVKAKSMGLAGLACEIAALLSGRNIFFRDKGLPDVDLRLRVDALRGTGRQVHVSPGDTIDVDSFRLVAREAALLKRIFAAPGAGQDDVAAAGLLLSFAYPDRIAQRRPSGQFLLRNGRGAELPRGSQLMAGEAYLAAAELDDKGLNSLVYLAAPLTESDVYSYMADQIEEEQVIAWDREARAVRARKIDRLGAIVLKDAPLASPDQAKVLDALIAGLGQEGLGALPWTRGARQLCDRVQMMRQLDSKWPDMTEEALLQSLKAWLGPHIYGMTRAEELQRLNLKQALESFLAWEQRRELEDLAPTHITVPSGQRVSVDYGDPAAPVLAVRLQEVFGLADTPRVAGGKIAVTLHLLSPANRPVQVTKDLASFWSKGYFEVRKDLAGRYPKHYWPDDPLTAVPTHRVRPPGR